MGDKTGIEWADATWNIATGCTKVSTGCKNCYAERWFPRVYGGEFFPGDKTRKRKFNDVGLHYDRLDQPLRWKRPRRIFVCSMGDLFHKDVPDKFILDVFKIMADAKQHIFQVLTKRPERMKLFLLSFGLVFPMPNVWLGTSVENQETADERIPILLDITAAAVRFISAEPLLGEINLSEIHCPGAKGLLDWVIAGGESGPGARPTNTDWYRQIRDDCRKAGVPFFMKQMTRKAPIPKDLLIREYPNA